jgi:CRP-like cAMP-binding protein
MRAKRYSQQECLHDSPLHDLGCSVIRNRLMTQMAQTEVCNRYHNVDQQLCRWLLLSLDRLPGSRLLMTHNLISSVIGCRREGVSEAAAQLQRLGIIRYNWGHIEVLESCCTRTARLRMLCHRS